MCSAELLQFGVAPDCLAAHAAARIEVLDERQAHGARRGLLASLRPFADFGQHAGDLARVEPAIPSRFALFGQLQAFHGQKGGGRRVAAARH